jgi:hypothetical protein
MAIIFKDGVNVTGNSAFNSNVTVSNTLTAGTLNAQISTISDSASFEGDVDFSDASVAGLSAGDFSDASVAGLSAGDVGLSGGITGTKYYYAPGSSSGSFVQKAVTLSNGIVTSWAT